jgi:hypothetical protein
MVGVGPRFLSAALLSFAVSFPGACLVKALGSAAAIRASGWWTIAAEAAIAFLLGWLASLATTAANIRFFRLPVVMAWRRIGFMAAIPLAPCTGLSLRYQYAGDSLASIWSQGLGLLLAILVGLQTGYQETQAKPEPIPHTTPN